MPKAQIGEVVASLRSDFLNKVGIEYLPCDGRYIPASNYPELAKIVNITPPGATWNVNSRSCSAGYGSMGGADCSSWHQILKSGEEMLVDGYGRWVSISSDHFVTYEKYDIQTYNTNYTCCCAVSPITGRILITYRGSSSGNDTQRIYYSDDNGRHWSSFEGGVYGSNIDYTTQFLVYDNSGVLYGYIRGYVRYSTNDGASWNDLQYISSSYGYRAILADDGNIYMVQDNGSTRYKIDTTAKTCASVSITKPASTIYSLARVANGRIMCGCTNGWAYSDNYGQTWTYIGNRTYGASYPVYLGDGVVLYTNNNALYISYDNGTTDSNSYITLSNSVSYGLGGIIDNGIAYVYTPNYTITSPETVHLPDMANHHIKVKDAAK